MTISSQSSSQSDIAGVKLTAKRAPTEADAHSRYRRRSACLSSRVPLLLRRSRFGCRTVERIKVARFGNAMLHYWRIVNARRTQRPTSTSAKMYDVVSAPICPRGDATTSCRGDITRLAEGAGY